MVTGVICLAALSLGLHRLLGWLWKARLKATLSTWRLRWTMTILAMVVLMFVAGISVVGIVHQTIWIVTSPEPFRQSSGDQLFSRFNLQRLASAMIAYADSQKSLPPAAIRDSNGRPLLSWRVLVLPYLEQNKLYKEFKLDEPWDSPHNLRLLNRMPEIYAIGPQNKQSRKSLTHYQVFVGPGTAFASPTGLRLPQDLPDPSHTILIAEAAEPVPWTKPEDLIYDPSRPLPRLGDLFPRKGTQFAMADGTARSTWQDSSDKTLRALITCNGGQIKIDD